MSSLTQDIPVRRFAAALVLPDEPTQILTAIAIRHRLPQWEPRIPLHITLTPPFTTHTTAEELEARWQVVAGGRTPFQVMLDGFGRFDNAESVFFVRVVENPELTRLASETLATVADLRIPRGHHFTPHVTLAASAPRQTIDEYVARTAADTPHLSFTCDRFSLLELDQNARQWDVVYTFIFTP
jgi:2'-5' RNA ligase